MLYAFICALREVHLSSDVVKHNLHVSTDLYSTISVKLLAHYSSSTVNLLWQSSFHMWMT